MGGVADIINRFITDQTKGQFSMEQKPPAANSHSVNTDEIDFFPVVCDTLGTTSIDFCDYRFGHTVWCRFLISLSR